jgi:hypothetical protein
MELWRPPHDRPHLLEWWRPLVQASERARRRRIGWPIHIDEFRLAGRVIRSGRPDIWIYEHHANGGSLCVDSTGATYRFIATPKAKGLGQFRECDIRTAVWRAGLPDVVAPVWYDDPHRPRGSESGLADRLDPGDPTGGPRPPDDAELREVSGGSAPVVRRGHLTVIDGGG